MKLNAALILCVVLEHNLIWLTQKISSFSIKVSQQIHAFPIIIVFFFVIIHIISHEILFVVLVIEIKYDLFFWLKSFYDMYLIYSFLLTLNTSFHAILRLKNQEFFLFFFIRVASYFIIIFRLIFSTNQFKAHCTIFSSLLSQPFFYDLQWV